MLDRLTYSLKWLSFIVGIVVLVFMLYENALNCYPYKLNVKEIFFAVIIFLAIYTPFWIFRFVVSEDKSPFPFESRSASTFNKIGAFVVFIAFILILIDHCPGS